MKLRGAVIGLGNIAVRGHLPAFTGDARLQQEVEIVAVMDVVDRAQESVAEILPQAKFYHYLDDLLDIEHLDFVDICTPPSTHAHYLQTCAERKLHIICEKPLTEKRDVTNPIQRALDGVPVVFVPCHQYKYSPLWRTIHDIINAGELGRVTIAQFNVFRLQADTGTNAWNPSWRIDKRQSGGGILSDTGAHYFYLVQYMFGMPMNVASVLRTLKHASYHVEDTAAVMLNYDDKLVQINLTWAASKRANSVLITGTEGSLAYDGVHLIQTRGDTSKEIPMPDISDKSQYIRWYAELFHEFVDRVHQQNYSRDLLNESINVMELLDRSYCSSEKQTWLAIR